MNNCDSSEILISIKNIENKINIINKDRNHYKNIKSLLKSLKPIELSLLAVKNNLPLNLSKSNYLFLFLEIYIKTKLDNYFFKFIDNNNIEIILNSFLYDKPFKLNKKEFNKDDNCIIMNEIEKKIMTQNNLKDIIDKFYELIKNKKYREIISLINIDNDNNNLLENNIILFYIHKFKKDILINIDEIKIIEFDILNLYQYYFVNFNENEIKDMIEKIINDQDLNIIKYIIIDRIGNLLIDKLDEFKKLLVEYYFNLIINKIKLNIQIKLITSVNINIEMILIHKKLNNIYNFENIYSIINNYGIIDEFIIKNNIRNILLIQKKSLILYFYEYNFINIHKITIFSINKIIEKITSLYFKKIVDKIMILLNTHYEYNEIVENTEVKLFNNFFEYYYRIDNESLSNDLLSNISIILSIIFKSNNFKNYEKLFLIYKYSNISNLYFYGTDKLNDKIYYLFQYIIRKNIIFKFINFISIYDIEINNFNLNIQNNIYYYYSLFIMKNNNFSAEIIIDNMYILKKKLNCHKYIDQSINTLLSFLIKSEYEFSYESEDYQKTEIEDKIENSKNLTNDLTCPICLEDNKNMILTNCNHALCLDCFNNLLSFRKPYRKSKCCMCRENITKIYI